MLYVHAKVEADEEAYTYQVYVTDTLRLLTENTARYSGGKYTSKRWQEVLDYEPDTRSGDEIVLDVLKNAGVTLA